jgi:hypothetical protein
VTESERLYQQIIRLTPMHELDPNALAHAKTVLQSEPDNMGNAIRIVRLPSSDLYVTVADYGNGVRQPRTPAMSAELMGAITEAIVFAKAGDHAAMRIMTWAHLPRVLAMAVELSQVPKPATEPEFAPPGPGGRPRAALVALEDPFQHQKS